MHKALCKECGYFKGQFDDDIKCPACDNELEFITSISESEFFKMSKEEKEQFVINYAGHDIDPTLKNKRLEYEANESARIDRICEEYDAKHPECPTCHTTKTQKISGLERGMSVLTLGLLSKKINKSFKCNNCGYTW